MSEPSVERWMGVRSALADFQKYLAPHIAPFPLIAANDFWWSDEEYYLRRPDGFPSRLRGVYLIFDDDARLLYVGSALVNFDKRVWSHDTNFKFRDMQRRWTDIIALPDEYAFLGLSLEYFLICRLQPACNTSFSGYEVPPDASCP